VVQPAQTNDVERVKRFVHVHLHCIVSNLKRISKISTLPPPGKISADAHAPSYQIVFFAVSLEMMLTSALGGIQQACATETVGNSVTPRFYVFICGCGE